MWNCTNCGLEVMDGLDVCLACGASLGEVLTAVASGNEGEIAAAEAVDASEGLVVVTSFASAEDSDRALKTLEAQGITAYGGEVADDSADWFSSAATASFQVHVLASELERAKQILAEAPPAPLRQTTAEIPLTALAPPASAPAVVETPHPEPPSAPPPLRTEAKFVAKPPEPAGPVVVQVRLDAPEGMSAYEFLRSLESKLSNLMDDKDVQGWTINPAFHPEVNAFIQANSSNTVFAKKAQALQKNRASYFATMKSRGVSTARPESPSPMVEPPPATSPEAPVSVTPTVGETAVGGSNPLEATKSNPKRSLRRRLALGLSLFFLTPVLVVVGAAVYLNQTGAQRLELATAETNQADPGWRLEELEAKRLPISDKNNGALIVIAMAKGMPAHWPAADARLANLLDLPPNERLDEQNQDLLSEAVERFQDSLAMSAQLANCATGRFPVRPFSARVLRPRVEIVMVDSVSRLLWLNAAFLGHAGLTDQALQMSRAILGAARSIGDEPDPWSQYGRLAARHLACISLERTLAQGTPKDGLAELQKELEAEYQQNLLEHSLRAARAESEIILAWLSGTEDTGLDEADFRVPQVHFTERDSCMRSLENWLQGGLIKQNHGIFLEKAAQAIAWTKLPPRDRVLRFQELAAELKASHDASNGLKPFSIADEPLESFVEAAIAFEHSQAELLVTIVAIACERHRQETGRWPGNLKDIVSDALKQDPFSDQPLRLKVLKDGLVIYSVGPDGEDNGGLVDHQNGTAPSKDIAFRLWNYDDRLPPKNGPETSKSSPGRIIE